MSTTHNAFFYGTLLRPDIVRNVLKNDGSHLTAAPAILLDHTRLRVAGRDYPAVVQSDKAQAELFGNQLLTAEQRAVQGVLVTGITKEDLAFLDDFEGEEYAREDVHVHQVGPGTDLDKLSLSPDSAKLPTGIEPRVSAQVYLWIDPCSRLEARTWSYEEFVREKVWRWERKATAHYTNAAAIDFGHPMKKHFAMAPEWLNLNHGSWGTVPVCVLEYAEKLVREQEAKPDKWFKNGTVARLAEIRKELATFVNADVEECVLITNTTHGVNHVLRNFQFNAGDVIITNHITYGAVQNSAQYFHDTKPHPELSVLHWTFPLSHDEMVDKFRAHLKAIPRRDSSQRVIAIIDAIASMPGVLMPWERMVQVCKEENVWSLVDAAHAIGQIPLDVHKADPDFLITNCHKWLYSRRASSLFYVPRRNHYIIKSAFAVSWMYRPLAEVTDWTKHFNDQFEASGSNDTSDCVSYLTIAEAMRFRRQIGGEKAINSYCHFLALHGGRLAAEILGTTVMDEDGSLTANMVNILLPLPIMPWQADEDLWSRWLEMKVGAIDNNIALQPLFHGGKWWWRASAQIWNELSDFETVANWFKVRCDAYRMADELEAKARAISQ